VLVTWQWLSQRAGTLPLVLAGPILRRVEPGMVCVWVATQQAQNITLTVRAAGTEVATNVTADLPHGQPTVQLGDHLFVALLTAVPTGAQLQPLVLYAYELAFTSADGTTSTSFASAMSAPGTASPDLSSIVYIDQASLVTLPSFSLPPQTLNQVQLAHASCRKAGGQGMDALPLLDKVIADARAKATDEQFAVKRPHQLFLTGDQSYADDVTDSYLGMCIDAAGWLMGTRQEPAPALLGILGPLATDGSGNHPFPDQSTLIGWKNLTHRPLGDTTPWDRTKWPWAGVRGKLASAAGLTAVSPDDGTLTPFKQLWPMGWREVNKYRTARNHLMALGEFYAALLFAWSPALWCPTGTDEPLPTPYDVSNINIEYHDDEWLNVSQFGAGVAAVRRVLANVPTYMICDDHEVSDDWFMNRLWCQRVLDLPGDTLGRRIVRNALIAFAVFQAWGNTPEQFDTTASSTPGGQLLTLLAAGKEMTDDLKDPSAADGVSALIGMPAPLAKGFVALSRPAGPLTWHYRWGPADWPYEVIVLDCRTLRRYSDGPIDPPQLLDDGTAPSSNPDQFAAQLGPPAASGVGVALVVVQTPVLGMRFIEEHQRSLDPTTVFAHDSEAWSLSPNGYELMLARLAAHNKAVILLSGDVHYSFAGWVDYYATAPWGGTESLSSARTARIVQLTSSAARNEGDGTRFLHDHGYSAFMQNPETWAGFLARPPYTEGTLASFTGYSSASKSGSPLVTKLNTPPVILDTSLYAGLFPLGTAGERPAPDWKYRIQFTPGARKSDPKVTPPGQLAALPSDVPGRLAAAAKIQSSIAQQHSTGAGSQIIGVNNVCLVTFTGTDLDSWHVQQAVLWRPDQPADWTSSNPLQSSPVSLTTPKDVTLFDIPLLYGPDPQMS
jgi:hypothetical protein